MKSRILISTVLLSAAAGVQCAGAAILLTDNFTDGLAEGGADNSGIDWYDRSANTGLTVVNDNGAGGIGSGNGLQMAITSTGAQTNRGLVGKLSQAITLANPGDTLSLSFSFRLISKGGATAPLNASTGFTFGFYNSNLTPIPANSNDSGASDNDFGFRGEFGTGTLSRVAIFKEENVGAGGLGTGVDGAAIAVNDPVPVMVGDFLPHTATITLTYNSASDLGIALTYDGAAVGSGSSSVPFLTFDELVFSQGGSNGFILDNVVVTSNVPEPGSAMLAALCGMAVMARRRR